MTSRCIIQQIQKFKRRKRLPTAQFGAPTSKSLRGHNRYTNYNSFRSKEKDWQSFKAMT